MPWGLVRRRTSRLVSFFYHLCLHVVEHVEPAEVGADIYARYFQSHQRPVRLVPSRFPSIGPRTAPVGIAICEAFRDFAVGLDALGMRMDDVAQEFGIQRVARGAVEFEQRVARLCAESRCAMFVLCAGPYGTCQVGSQLGQWRVVGQTVVERDGPRGT